MVGFIFGGDTGETPESVKRKREIAMALLGQSRAPRNVGEGLNALGDGIVANVMNRRAGAAETAGQAAANKAFGDIDFSWLFGGGSGAYPQSVAAGGSPTSGAATGTAIAASPEASTIKQGLEARGLPSHVADAFVMNFQDESGLNPGINERNPTVPGSRGGFGLYQLTGPRRVAYEQFAAQRGVAPSDTDAQLDFLMTELQGPEARAAKSILSAPDTGSAAQAIVNDFLRPAESHRASRAAKYAKAGGVQVASLDPSIGLPSQAGGATIQAGDYNPADYRGNAPANGAAATVGGPQLTYDDKGLRFVDEGAQRSSGPLQTMPNRIDPNNPVDPSRAAQPMPDTMSDAQIDPRQALQPMANQPQPTPAKAPYDFTGNPQLSAGAGMPFQGGQQQPQQIASVEPQQQSDPKTAIRDALLRQNDMALGGALAPQGQAQQQVADTSGAFPPAPTGQPLSGQQGGEARQAMVQKLMQAAQNPWMNDNQRAMVNALLQNQMQQGDPMRQLQMQKAQLEVDALRAKPQTEYGFTTLPDGTVLRTDKRSGNAEPIYSAGQKPTGDMQEYEYAKGQGYQGTFADYQQSMKKAGASSTSVTVGEGDKFYEALDKKNADTFAALSDTGIQARSKLAQIERLGGLMQASPSGASAALKLAAGEYGIKTDGLDDLQASQALINELVPQQRQPGSGPMSDADLALFKQSLPRIINTPDGNNLILDTMRGITQYQIQMGDIADRVANRELSAAEARNEIKNLKNPLEGFRTSSKEQGSKNTSTGVQWSID